MRNLVFLGFILLVIFFTVGWFLDWYSFTNVKNEQGKTSVQFNLDGAKIKQDVEKGADKFKKEPQVKPTETRPASQTTSWFN
jgi:hypothetical protein